jgi:YkoY family integral membrane protein
LTTSGIMADPASKWIIRDPCPPAIVQTVFASVTEFFQSQTFTTQDLAVVLLLTVLEGVLSIDNALVLGLLAKRLPKHQQGNALTFGLIAAIVFRCIAIFMASLLLRWTFVKFLGGAYLVYIAVRHLFFESKEKTEEKLVLDEHGNPTLVEKSGQELTQAESELEIQERVPVYVKPETVRQAGLSSFWPTVVSISLTDIAFAVDSILAAIALVGAPPVGLAGAPPPYHPKLWVICLGGALGVIILRFAAGMFIKLLDRFPRFELTAYLLVIVIGIKLLADWGCNSDWSFNEPKWAAEKLGGWKQSFEEFENRRQHSAIGYEKWLEENWIITIKPHAEPEGPLHQVPHLLDFHNIRRPESIAFWLLMVISFCTGFIPPRKRPGGGAPDEKPVEKKAGSP